MHRSLRTLCPLCLVCVALLTLLTALPALAAETTAWQLHDLRNSETVALDEAAKRLAGAEIILVGESHDQAVHHAGELAVIRAMHAQARAQGFGFGVGLEMWRAADQGALDDWVAGKTDEAAMAKAFAEQWNGSWELYRDIFLYCRDRHIPMAGLNVSPELTRQVAKEGFASLSEEQRAGLPMVACIVDPDYETFIRATLGMHGGHGTDTENEEIFTHFCEAQMVWDTAFAVNSLRFMADRGLADLVLLTGMVHAWKPAVPAQLTHYAPSLDQAVIMQLDPGNSAETRLELGPEDADFVLEPIQ